MKSFIPFILLLVIPSFIFAQNKTYLGFDIGRKYDIYQSIDNGDALYTEPFTCCPVLGINLGQEINKTFTFETGIYLNSYGGGFGINGIGYTGGNNFLAYQIPLRLKANLNIIEDKLRLVTTVGYTFAYNLNPGSTGSGSIISTSTSQSSGVMIDSSIVEYNYNVSQREYYGLLETGISIEYIFKNDIIIYLAANYLTGFKRMVEYDVKYTLNNQGEQNGKAFSNGDYYSIFLGLRYPISNIWNKKDKLDN